MINFEDETIKKIWSNVMDNMKSQFDSNAYNTFFLPLVPKTIQDNKFILEAPTRFVKEVVMSSMFANKINDYLKELTNTNFEIEVKETQEFVIEKEQAVKLTEEKLNSNLNPEFVFSNFVVGPCNRECHEAALAVALNPGKFYNPLFIYGRAGIGKTHLLHAIGNYCKENENRTMNIYYTTANDFIDEFIRSSQNKDIDTMKAKFRSIDILLLDDVQFLAGKDKTGEVFFQIFNNLFNEKKQIVLTSDRNPNDLKGLESRLVSRFASGLTVGMNAPESQTAISILKQKIQSKKFDINNIDEDVIQYIAENYSTDVRQLEGALTRLIFYVTTVNKCKRINLDVALEALSNITPPKKKGAIITFEDILNTVSEYYNVPAQQILGTSRAATIVKPRFIVAYLSKTMTNMTYDEIGTALGKDHSSIMHACESVEQHINNDTTYALAIDKIKQLITNC